MADQTGRIVAVVVQGAGREPTGFCWMCVDGSDVYAAAQGLPVDMSPAQMRDFLESVKRHRPDAAVTLGVERAPVPGSREEWAGSLATAAKSGEWTGVGAMLGAECLAIDSTAWTAVLRGVLREHGQPAPKGARAWRAAALWGGAMVLGHEPGGYNEARAALLAAGLLRMGEGVGAATEAGDDAEEGDGASAE